MIRTKTLATLGPATSSPEMIEALVAAGVDAVRLNFSHGTLEEHGRTLTQVRKVAAHLETPVAIVGDLSGPKIRIGRIDGTDAMLEQGASLVIQREPILGNATRLSTTFPALIDEAAVGDRVLINDGLIALVVEARRPDELHLRCLIGGLLSDHKGVNLPDTQLTIPALTDKDHQDAAWAIEQQLDYLALSFVRRADDVSDLRRILDGHCSDIQIIAKIEKPQAIDELDAIISAADGILVARGDLGVEMDLARVPILQKDMTRRCQAVGKPVIIATQMLQSMIDSPTPTRAETTDVANAVLDRTDAVMLSAETAVGRYPIESVQTMQRICSETEKYLDQVVPVAMEWHGQDDLPITSSLASSARSLAESLRPPLLAVWTQSGASARLLSKQRFNCPIIALTEHSRTCNKLALHYGVTAVLTTCPPDTVAMLDCLDDILRARQWAREGDHVIVIAGTHFEHTGGNNALLIHEVGHP
jgi:pyruvate kinase